MGMWTGEQMVDNVLDRNPISRVNDCSLGSVMWTNIFGNDVRSVDMAMWIAVALDSGFVVGLDWSNPVNPHYRCCMDCIEDSIVVLVIREALD